MNKKVKLRKPMPFTLRVEDVVRSIPKGQTLSYKDVARLAGKPNAARAVGTIMAKNQDKSVPCHRVIKSDGKLGGYNGLRGEKHRLLKTEGALK
ncbi:MAG: MGMT family protein [Patescibacteria group bacterium]